MIYSSAMSVINSNVEDFWHNLSKFLQLPEQGQYMKDCKLVENYYDGFSRIINIDGDLVTDRVFMLKDQSKIVIRLEEHPLLIGDTIYQIIASDDPLLSERKITLCIVMSWRMRPGIIEAPKIDIQKIIDDLIETISKI